MMTTIIKIFNGLGETMFPIGLTFLWQSTVIIVVASLIWAGIKRLKSARLNRFLWSVTIIMLFFLPIALIAQNYVQPPKLALPCPALFSNPKLEKVTQRANFPNASTHSEVNVEQVIKPNTSTGSIAGAKSDSLAAAEKISSPGLTSCSTKAIVAIVWVFGSLLFLLRWLFGWLWLRHLSKSKDNLMLNLADLGLGEFQRRVAGRIKIIPSPQILMPLLSGMFRPTIFVPTDLFKKLTNKQRKAVLLHELAHWYQRDLIVQTIYQLVSVFFWFQPLLIWVKKRFHQASEESCDDRVIATEKDGPLFARALMETAKYAYKRNRLLLTPVAMMSSRSSLTSRIKRILSSSFPDNRSPGRISIIALILASIITLTAVNGVQLKAPSEQSQSTSPSSYKVSISEGASSYPSVKMALEAAKPGDLILIKAGKYEGGFSLKDGVKICGEDREKTIIKLGRDRIKADGVKDAGVYNLTIKKGEVGSHFELNDSKKITISNCAVIATEFQYWGAEIKSSQVNIDNTIFKFCSYSGIKAVAESKLEVKGCAFMYNNGVAIEVSNGSELKAIGNLIQANRGGITVNNDVQVNIMGNNIIYNNWQGVGLDGDVKVSMKHNTIIGNKGSGVYASRMTTGEITDNIFVGNEWGLGGKEREFFQVNAHHNLVWQNKEGNYGAGFEKGEGDIEADPLFADIANRDFRLQQNSPALGAGSDSSNIGAWNSTIEKQASQWMFTPLKPKPEPGGRILVVQAKLEVTQMKEEDYLTYAKTLAKELSDVRTDEAAVEKINQQLQEVAQNLKPGKNLLLNSDFETGEGTLPEAWALRGGHLIQLTWDAGLGYNNSKGVYIRKTEGKFPFASLAQTIDCPEDDTLLRLSAKVKAKDVGKAILDLVFLDDKGEWIYHIWVQPIGTPWGSGTHDWKQYIGYAYIPPGTKKIEVSLQMYWPGELWLDDYECCLMK